MDYSLFLIILEVPNIEEARRDTESIKMSCKDLDLRTQQNLKKESLYSK